MKTKNPMIRAVSAATLSWLAISLAHAGYITVDTGIWRTWQQYGTANPQFETVQEAYADTKARIDRCDNGNPQRCWTLENLRPDPDHLFWAYNGVAYWWVADIRLCTGGSCTPNGGAVFVQNVRCPVYADRSFGITQLNGGNPPPDWHVSDSGVGQPCVSARSGRTSDSVQFDPA